jgi:hypothetical protein
LPEVRASSSAQTIPNASIIPAAAEIADQVERRHRGWSAAPIACNAPESAM